MKGLLTVEESATVQSSHCAWRQLARLRGQECGALEAQLDRQPCTSNPPLLRISKARQALQEALRAIREASRLWPDQTERLAGCWRMASTQQHGREGQANLRPFITRRHERTQTNIDRPLATACDWWLESLQLKSPREVPHVLGPRHTVVTFSDGKTPVSHVEVALCNSRTDGPSKGRMQAPEALRTLWRAQRTILS